MVYTDKISGEVITQPVNTMGPRECAWDIQWQDFGISPELLSNLGPMQRVNHFLGMYNLARKNTLGIHLKRFKKEFPQHYQFFPETWIYPSDFHEILEYNQKKMRKRQEKIALG